PNSALTQYDRHATSDLVDAVSGERIMRTIQDLQDFGSRAFYLNSSDDAASYIFGQFQATNIAVEYQEFMAGVHSVKNVVATIPGASADAPQFLFGAHYDSENRDARTVSDGQTLPAPGADDDASGVACVVELARVLSSLKLRNTVKFVTFGAEENGYDSSGRMAGSMSYVESEKVKGISYDACWILDMIGYGGGSENHTVIIVNENSLRLGSDMQEMVGALGIELSIEIESNSSSLNSDHARFWSAGYPAALLIESDPTTGVYEFNPYYHSTEDTVDKLSEGQIVAVAQGLVATLMDMSTPESVNEDGGLVLISATIAIGSASTVIVCIYYIRRKVKEQ
ncbi:MAG: M20/M25/M40 family metallo-hydrolase, partial [Euryarchaeota archaeon]|nr:M20/M25/M40 family metallo-hydrolase [Euryarchaeota archaeon]